MEPSELSEQEGLRWWGNVSFAGLRYRRHPVWPMSSLVLCVGPRPGDEVGSCQREDPAAPGRMPGTPYESIVRTGRRSGRETFRAALAGAAAQARPEAWATGRGPSRPLF